jgi:crotonobetainyl-CoA:carnitine CoA-transferase CaiB-like acyl-CoA transferase
MPGALAGVRVLDFTHILNGPFSTLLLGHLGADVIKVEPPRGDSFRWTWMAPDAPIEGYEFMAINANKKSIVIDLKKDEGRELVRKLIAVSDVMVENYARGTMESFGLDYDAARAINPRIIYACTRGFGDSGPNSAYGSTANTNNGVTGWTTFSWGYSGSPGTKSIGIGDEASGVNVALGVVAALYAREHTGEGQKIEVAMQEALLGFMVSSMHEHFTGNFIGNPPKRVGDGYYNLLIRDLADENWRKLAALIGVDVADARFASREARRKNDKELQRLVVEWASDKPRQFLWDNLKDLGYTGGPVLTFEEVLADPHLKARGAFRHIDHPTNGPATLVNPWIRMSGTPASIRSESPVLGQHTDEVLTTVLGLSGDEVATLRAGAVVR